MIEEIPPIGLGTWNLPTPIAPATVQHAIELGYRHIDCAPIYGNQAEVGTGIARALANSTVNRDELWVTSKLWNNAHLPTDVEPALKSTLSALRLEYVDLYLIHWPVSFRREVLIPQRGTDLIPWSTDGLLRLWDALETLRQRKLCRNIGVSNFSMMHLQPLLNRKLVPDANQVELHPYLPQVDLVGECSASKVATIAHCPLGSSHRPAHLTTAGEPVLMEEPGLNTIALELGCTVAQVLLRWAIQRGTIPIPKSTRTEHLCENLANLCAPDLDEFHKSLIAQLAREQRYLDGSHWDFFDGPKTSARLWQQALTVDTNL